MRKSLWIIPLLFAAVGAPNAHAQTYIYSESDTTSGDQYSFTTNAVAPATANSLYQLPAGDLMSVSITGSELTAVGVGPLVAVILDCEPSGDTIPVDYTCLDFLHEDFTLVGGFDDADEDSVFGPLLVDGNTTVQVTEFSSTPEPGTAVLWLTGIGLVLVMTRKRIAQDLPQAR